MSKENRIYTCKHTSRSRQCKSFILMFVLGVSSACLSQGKNASQETNNVSATPSQADAKPFNIIAPTRFDYVHLFDRSNWLVAEPDRVVETKDGGNTWAQIYHIEASNINGQVQGMSFVDMLVGFLIVGDHLVRTDNGGMSWVDIGEIKSSNEKVFLSSCYFVDELHGWVVGRVWQEGSRDNTAQYIGITLVTQDGGRTWQKQQLSVPSSHLRYKKYWGLNDVLFDDIMIGWAIGDSGLIFRTEDGGNKWHLVNAGDVDYQHINFLDKNLGWATYKYGSSSWGVSLTTDGGRKWKLLNESLAYGTWPIYAVFLTPIHGFAISLKLYETQDAGHRWKYLSGGVNLGELTYTYLGQTSDGLMIVFGTKGENFVALISPDGGRTWQPSIGIR
jgi:photosystem II stability/assembly factor-like uncharacterized protein